MPKFKVEICRIGYAFKTIEVNAPTGVEAASAAQSQAGNLEYNEKSATYEIESVRLARTKHALNALQ